MNCRNFAVVVSDLVRSELASGQRVLKEVTVQEEARAHAAACPRCQNRLMDERELAKGLHLVSQADREKSASLIDETRLRSAFRESRLASTQNLGGTIAPPRPPSRATRVWWGLAVAACVTLLVGAAVLWRVPEVKPVGPVAVASPTPRVGSQTPVPFSGPPVQLDRVRQEVSNQKRVKKPRLVGIGVQRVVDSSYVAVSLGGFRPVLAEHEETTEFFPMAQGADAGPMTSGQVVRVVMPRTAMTYFGLPMNFERADEKVKADVLLGEDGLARAIRFVR